jgi:hypothetical protein
MLEDDSGEPWAELRLLVAIDTLDGPDETFAFRGPDVEEGVDHTRLTWQLRSSAWASKRLVLEANRDALALRCEVEGSGRPTDVTFLGGRAALANGATGRFLSGARFGTVFCPAPGDPARLVSPATESIDNTVAGGSEGGRGQWFFTPAPFLYAASRTPFTDGTTVPTSPWLTFSLEAPSGTDGFIGFGYRAQDRGFAYVLDYEGQTCVEGGWTTPSLVIAPATDPYVALADHRRRLESAGLAPAPDRAARPGWWREPMFCGWGAQCAEATGRGESLREASGYATQERYDAWLGHLESRGVVPGTVVVDDKWQVTYGMNEPDRGKWPDLRSWIAERHARGQRVLLWWKAWDAEGLPPEACITTPDGRPIAIDPDSPAGDAAIRATVHRMLAAEGLDADGLKIDFTARTPSGTSLRHHGPHWGVSLLRRLLTVVREAAKAAKPDALLIGHAPEPGTAAALDVIRLNDMLRLDDPGPPPPIVGQMEHRARIVAAACPDHLIDTDDWCVPGLAEWRTWTRRKPLVGIPALYYATHLDLTGERLEDEDYELLRETWASWRAANARPTSPGASGILRPVMAGHEAP